MTASYPLFLDVRGRTCCVVGGGRIATGRVQGLLQHGAVVRLVAPAATQELEEMVTSQQISDHRRRPYQAADLQGCMLAVAATDDPAVNARVAADARAAGVLCNVVDRPDLGDVTVPALVRRGGLSVAVTTHGTAPAVAADARRRIEGMFGPEWGVLLELLSQRRERLKAAIPDPARRAAAVRAVVNDDLLALISGGHTADAAARLDQLASEGGA
ncbi:MAG: bifunctional precorrin-2 dehydrogenase/sirohydrochlorin ferrochelatase [Thermoleophilia bacterium]